MKKYTTLALIGAIVAGVAGLISIDAISATPLVTMQGASDFHESGLMIGHVTYEVRGADGQVKHYLQGDNFITNIGIRCAATAIFDSSDSMCASPGNFAYIAIGNATGSTAAVTDIVLDTSIGPPPGGEMDPRSAKINANIATVGSNTEVTLTNSGSPFTFTKLGTSPNLVTQSGIFNATAPGSTSTMFAIKDISPAISVLNADTLTVTWKITLSNP